MSTSQKHYLEEITRNHNALSPVAHEHIKSCSRCRLELNMMLRIEEAVREMPKVAVPNILKKRLFQKIFQPAYKIWHVLFTGMLILASLLLLPLAPGKLGFQPERDLLIALYALCGILLVILVLPISYKLWNQYHDEINDLEESFDHYLEHPIRNIAAIIRKRNF